MKYLLLGVADGGLALSVVLPVDDLVVLQELGGNVLVEGALDVLVEVLLTAPALEAVQTEAAQQGVIGSAAEGGPVQDLRIALVVSQEADDVGVQALGTCTAVGGVGGPGCQVESYSPSPENSVVKRQPRELISSAMRRVSQAS